MLRMLRKLMDCSNVLDAVVENIATVRSRAHFESMWWIVAILPFLCLS